MFLRKFRLISSQNNKIIGKYNKNLSNKIYNIDDKFTPIITHKQYEINNKIITHLKILGSKIETHKPIHLVLSVDTSVAIGDYCESNSFLNDLEYFKFNKFSKLNLEHSYKHITNNLIPIDKLSIIKNSSNSEIIVNNFNLTYRKNIKNIKYSNIDSIDLIDLIDLRLCLTKTNFDSKIMNCKTEFFDSKKRYFNEPYLYQDYKYFWSLGLRYKFDIIFITSKYFENKYNFESIYLYGDSSFNYPFSLTEFLPLKLKIHDFNE